MTGVMAAPALLVTVLVTTALVGCSTAAPAAHTSKVSSAASSKAASAAPVATPSSVTPVPSVAVLAQGASDLQSADDELRSQFATGVSEIDTPAGVTWWTTVNLSMSSITLTSDAYKKAQTLFGNYDPPALDDWSHTALLPLSGDLVTWYQAASGSAEQTTDQAKVTADLAAADADVKLVLSGQTSQL